MNIRMRALVALVGTLSAVFLATAVQGAEEKVEVVRIASVAYPGAGKTAFIGSTAIISNQGGLEKELQKLGIRLEWVPIPVQSVGATTNEAFANHSIEFAQYGDLPAVILNGNGVETRVVVPGGSGSNVYIVVPPGSSAKTIHDLKGKRVALHRGRPWEIPFSRLLEANGLKLSDFKISNLNPQAGSAALAAGNVDALVALSDTFQLLDRNLGKIIWSTKLAGQDWKMRMELWGRKDFIERHPEITQVIVNAHLRAAQWSAAEENRPEYIRIATASGQSESTLRQEYADDTVSWRERWSPVFDDSLLEHYQHVAKYSYEAKLIRKPLDVTPLFEPRFVRAALKELKLEGFWQEKPSLSSASAAAHAAR
jgi:sulfonate transport system substrate-binding protein